MRVSTTVPCSDCRVSISIRVELASLTPHLLSHLVCLGAHIVVYGVVPLRLVDVGDEDVLGNRSVEVTHHMLVLVLITCTTRLRDSELPRKHEVRRLWQPVHVWIEGDLVLELIRVGALLLHQLLEPLFVLVLLMLVLLLLLLLLFFFFFLLHLIHLMLMRRPHD